MSLTVVVDLSDVIVDIFSGSWTNRADEWDTPLCVRLGHKTTPDLTSVRLFAVRSLEIPKTGTVVFDNGDTMSWTSKVGGSDHVVEGVTWSVGATDHAKKEIATEAQGGHLNKSYYVDDFVPKLGSTYDGKTFTYIPPVVPILKTTWSGGGTLVGDVYELTPNGILQAVLTLEKWDSVTNSAINTGGEGYWVCTEGVAAKPDAGKVTLDGLGRATVTFTPAANEFGMAVIKLMPVGQAPIPDNPVMKLGLG